jgi:adenylate cyclase
LVNGLAPVGSFAIANANHALRLSPFDSTAFQSHLALGIAAIQQGRYAEAASHCARATQANPGMPYLYLFQALALALAGRLEEARPLARRGLELFPDWRVGTIVAAFGLAPAFMDKLAEGARILGLPE